MRLTALLWLCLSFTALAAPDGNPDQDSVNWSSLKQAIKTMTFNHDALPIPTKTANLDNISAPPRSMIGEIVSAVPPSVLVDLVNPARRSSLASEFKAGNTPTWYAALPTDVKSYMAAVKSQIKDGALTATTGLAYQTQTAEVSTTTMSGSTGSATASGSSSSSTSSGTGAAGPKPTGGLAATAMGALGVLGVAMAL